MDGWTDRLTQPLIEMQGRSKNIDSNNLHNLSLPSSHFSLSHNVFVLPPSCTWNQNVEESHLHIRDGLFFALFVHDKTQKGQK